MPSYYNLEEGVGRDESGQEIELTSNEVHLGITGGEVLGSSENDKVFTNYGNAYIDLGAGVDEVRFWGRQSKDFEMSYELGVFTLTYERNVVEIRNVELIKFDDRTISTVQVDGTAEFFAKSKIVYRFSSSETHESYTYNNTVFPSGLVRYGVSNALKIDAKLDGVADLLVPMDKGYRTGVDTRLNYLVFEDIYGGFNFSAELTSKSPFASSPIVTTFIDLENQDQKSIITVSHDSARIGEESNDVYWKNGDLTITRQDPFNEITDTLITDGMLPASDRAGRNNATNAHALAVGDFNGDGMQDIFVPDWSKRFILQQQPNGGFEFISNSFLNSIGNERIVLSLLANDFNSDGVDDLVVGYPEGLSSFLILGSENGFDNSNVIFTLPESEYGLGNSLHMQSFSSDYDGDGDDDLIFVHTKAEPYYGGSHIQYLENDGFMNFQDKTDVAFPAQADLGFRNGSYHDYWASFDFDNDGDEDFFGAFGGPNGEAMNILVAENKNGIFELKSYPINYTLKFLFTDPTTLELKALTHHDLLADDGKSLDSIFTLNTLVSTNIPKGEKLKIWLGSETEDLNRNDIILSLDGPDVIDAAGGIDTVIYTSGSVAINKITTGYNVDDDTLINVERIRFADTNIALDLDNHAGQTAKILGAVLGKEALNDKKYVGIGLHFLDSGVSYEELMDLALKAVLGDDATDHLSVIKLLYKNILHVDASDSDTDELVELLDNGMSIGEFGVMAADTSFNAENIDLIGLRETGLAYALYEG